VYAGQPVTGLRLVAVIDLHDIEIVSGLAPRDKVFKYVVLADAAK